VLVAIGVFTAYARTTQSSPSPSLTPRPALAAKAVSSQIAFMRDPAGVGQAHKELYIMSADGSGQRLLARETGLGEMAWSPDGREIEFSRASSENPGLYAVKVDGSGERRLTRNGHGFAWAPDGQTIAFTRVRGGYRDIWVMNADGTGQRRLAQRGHHHGGRPTGG
jgi:dipeptidyl aminopeptidase/acylaminoacyl peptidase